METFWKHDLSERLGPMTTKELRQSMRRGSFVIPFLLIQFLAVMATAVEFQKPSSLIDKDQAGMLNIALLFGSGPFWAVVGAICVVVMPLGGFLLMRQELEEGNHELLLLTHLGRWKIVLGKFLTLWGLSALTFVSLLPFVVVRYLLGGVEWWYEMACVLTVLGGSAIICAGVIGASAYRSIAGRIVILILFLGSMLVGAGIPLASSAAVSKGCGLVYHLTAFSAVACYVAMGLALARSQLRLVVLAYEVKPSGMIIALLVCSPFAIGLSTVVTAGWGGLLGLLGMGFVAIRLDISPKAPKRIPAPAANIPPISAIPEPIVVPIPPVPKPGDESGNGASTVGRAPIGEPPLG